MQRLAYLPALDGLRALAVAMVFAYHLEFSWASGGFLGVDLFFVISGYLITRLLLDEHDEHGRIALGGFWTRRFRRLVPAMVVMIAATLVATRRWGLPEQWRSIGGDAIAALSYVANWRFVIDDQSYFDASLGPSPLLHTWSLAVEEQWYLLWPIAMVGLCAWATRSNRARWVVVTVILGAAAGSAAWMALSYVPSDPSRVYFGTDTRAQQLLIGAALGWLLHVRPSLARIVSTSGSRLPFGFALATLIAAAVVVDDDSTWLYRGGFLAISVVAAVVVLGTTAPRGSGLGWLGQAPLVWIGRRSYGIYLWHWPVILFMDPATGGTLGRWPLVMLQVVVTMAAAEASYRLVETPVRRSTAPPVRTVALWSASALVVGAAGIVWLVPPPSRDLDRSDAAFADLDDLLDMVVDDPDDLDDRSDPDGPTSPAVANVPPQAPDSPDGDGSAASVPATGPARRVLLFGDSAAFTLAEQLELPSDAHWDVQAFVTVGCPITPGDVFDAGSSRPIPPDDTCGDDWVGLWPDYAAVLEPDIVVVMVGAWEVFDHEVDGSAVRFPSEAWSAVVRDAFADAVAGATTAGVPVVVLDVPCMQGGPGSLARADPQRVAAVNDVIRSVVDDRRTTSNDISIAEISATICPDGDDDLSIDSVPARYDGVHYTRAGAAVVWPWLFDELDQVLDGSDAAVSVNG